MNLYWNSFIQAAVLTTTKYLTKKVFEQNSHCQSYYVSSHENKILDIHICIHQKKNHEIASK